MEKEPISTVLIRFSDCDPFGHLNNARYIDYFLNVREDHLQEHYDLSLYQLGRQGIGWVVAENKVAYFKPAISGEQVKIKTMLVRHSEHHLVVEMSMYNTEMSICKALAWSVFVPVSLQNGKKSSHEPRFMDLFNTVGLQMPEPLAADGFEQRKGFYKKLNHGVLLP